jgi:hypothetical protein
MIVSRRARGGHRLDPGWDDGDHAGGGGLDRRLRLLLQARSPRFGIAMAVVLFLMCAAASEITARNAPGSLSPGQPAIFTVGRVLQFLGHKFEA